MPKEKDNTIWIFLGVIVVLVILVGGGIGFFSNKCVGEFKQMSTGIAMNTNEKCCDGLVLKSPQGFTGGAWCVKSEIDVVCERIDNIPGIYAKSRPDIRPITIKLLREGVCS